MIDISPDSLGWADRILPSDLILDRVYGREIISCIQCYLDARNAALPASARQARAAKASAGSQDEYPSLGFDFSEGDFAVLCDDPVTAPTDFRNQQDLAFARVSVLHHSDLLTQLDHRVHRFPWHLSYSVDTPDYDWGAFPYAETRPAVVPAAVDQMLG